MMNLPELIPNMRGQSKMPDGEIIKFRVNRFITMEETGNPEKVFILQELIDDKKRRMIRIGYYIIGKKLRVKGKWVWGQFCPIFLNNDLEKLLQTAREAGIIRNGAKWVPGLNN